MRGDIDSRTITDNTTPGLSWLVTVDYDQELTEPEGDGYTPKQVEAFRRGDWNYVVVGVTPVIDGIELDSMADYLGAVEYGYYVLTDEDDNQTGTASLFMDELISVHPVPDMISEAKSTLKARLAELAPKFADIAGRLRHWSWPRKRGCDRCLDGMREAKTRSDERTAP